LEGDKKLLGKKVFCRYCEKEISDAEEVKIINNFTLEQILDAPKLCLKCMSNFVNNRG